MRPFLLLAALLALAPPSRPQDLKVEILKTAAWPNGLVIPRTSGVSWGDLDGDGWVDFFGAQTGQVWRNRGGREWYRLPDVLTDRSRYGQAIGDYDNDGFADVATEPRMNVPEGLELLRNLGATGSFVNVADDPNIVDVKPYDDAETNCWADVDFDGDLDLFVPVYPPWVFGSPGNFFLQNLGPTGPGGEYRFTEVSGPAGLDNPPGTARPEGAEFCDVDGDGDLDLYCNGTLYQNRSGLDLPFFEELDTPASGIPHRDVIDEGLVFLDYDLDGDFDLMISWCGPPRIRMLESRGDGRFFLTPEQVIEDNSASHCLGVTRVDWDNDGDLDFSTSSVFHRNLAMDTGDRKFVPATTPIPDEHLAQSVLAWADWDKDGDQDLLIGTHAIDGYLYDNTTYGASTPLAERRFVRVRVVRDSGRVARGLETEFGASVELVVEGDAPGVHRLQLVSSSGGYVNQHEYTLHFGLPPDPDPQNPEQDVRFDVVVDFPSDPTAGRVRVDRRVNPRLGRIDLADLSDLAAREITVFRSGRVVAGGCTFEPVAGNDPRLDTSTSGLALTDDAAPLADPEDAPAGDWYVGLDFDTALANGPLRLKEVVFDGRAAADVPACQPERLAVWDVTDPQAPFVIEKGAVDLVREGRNHRARVALDARLEPQHAYRVVARVDRLRASPIQAPVVDGPLTVHGGLSFQDLSPCDGQAVVGASADPAQVYLAVRVAADAGPLWVDQGHALAGGYGIAQLSGSGSLEPGTSVELTLTGAPPHRPTVLVSGSEARCLPVAGGILFPALESIQRLATDASGGWTVSVPVPPTAEPGRTVHWQVWWEDAGAPEWRAASNALSGTTSF